MARQRGSTFQADVVLRSGKRVRPQGFGTLAEADLWEAQARANDEKGMALPPLPSPKTPLSCANGSTLGEVRRLCLSTPKMKGGRGGWLGSKDYRNAEARSQYAVDFFGEDCAITGLDFNEMERYARALRDAGNRPATINRKIAAVSKLLTFAAQRGLITAAPSAPHEEEPEGRIRFLTPAEEQQALAMLAIMGEHELRTLMGFLIDTGARVSEALELEAGDYQLGPKPSVTFWITKGGKARTIPLTPRAAAALQHFDDKRDNAGPLAHIPYWELRAAWDRARARLGATFADVTIHIFRHTCCSRLVQAGVDLRRVMEWMGHADIKTTLKYAHLAPGNLQSMADVLQQMAQPAVPPSNVVPLRTSTAGERTLDDVTAHVPKPASA